MDHISNSRPSVAVVPKPEFDPEEGRYHCCCGCCHVTVGVQLIAALELVLLIFQFVSICVVYAQITERLYGGNFSSKYQDDSDLMLQFYRIFEQNPDVSLAAGICSAVVGITVVVLMVVGVRKDKPKYLVPHLVCQILAILALLAAGGVVIHGVVTVPDRIGTVDKNVQWTALVVLLTFLALFLVAVCIVVYFTFVVWKGYTFLKARQEYETAAAAYAYYYNNPHRHPSMTPSAILVQAPSGSGTPRGSTLLLAPPAAISPSPRGSVLLIPPSPNAPRGSFLVVQHQF